METASINASVNLDTSGFDRAMERVKSGLSGIKAGIQSVEKAGLKLASTGLGLDSVTSQIQAADALAGNNIIETFLKGLSEALQALGAWASASGAAILTTITGIGIAFAAWNVRMLQTGILGLVAALGSLGLALQIIAVNGLPNLTSASFGGFSGIQGLAEGVWDAVDSSVAFGANLATIAGLLTQGTSVTMVLTSAMAVKTAATTAGTVATAAGTAATTTGTAATWGFNAALSANPIGAIILVIVALIAVIMLLIKFWPEITAAAAAAWEWIQNAWATVADWFNANVIQPVVGFFTGLWTGITEAVTAAIAWLVNAWGTVAGWFSTNVIQPVAGFFTNLWAQVSGTVSAAVQWLVNAWSTVAGWINVNVIQPIVSFFTNLWAQLNTAVTTAVQWLVNAWSTVANWINANVVQPIVGFFTGLWAQLNTAVTTAINLFRTAWSTVANWFNTNVIQPIAGFFTGLWDSIRKLFTSVGTTVGNAVGGAFKSAVNAVIGFVEGTINLLIRGINAAIGIINLIPGVNIRTLSLLSIPRMAQGGVVARPTIAMIGEAGREAVLPLENNTGWMAEMARQLAAAMNGPQLAGGGDILIPVYLDGNLLDQVIVSAQERKNMRSNGR